MSKGKKQKLLKKTTVFNGRKLVLYSLDGEIWSNRTWELEKIAERHESERITLHEDEKEKEEGEPAEKQAEAQDSEEKDKISKVKKGAASKSSSVKPNTRQRSKKITSNKKGRLKTRAA